MKKIKKKFISYQLFEYFLQPNLTLLAFIIPFALISFHITNFILKIYIFTIILYRT